MVHNRLLSSNGNAAGRKTILVGRKKGGRRDLETARANGGKGKSGL